MGAYTKRQTRIERHQATSAVPIVFVLATDPVGGGLVASLPRPGGNVTGLSNQGSDLAGGRLEILHEVTGLRRLAILANVGFTESVLEMGEVEAAANKLGIEVVAKLGIERAEDIAPAFETLQGRADALCPRDGDTGSIRRSSSTSIAQPATRD
jgi:putative ABC transport system substrate-binding protein